MQHVTWSINSVCHSARQGLRWWQFDSSWLIIRAIRAIGLAKISGVADNAAIDFRKDDRIFSLHKFPRILLSAAGNLVTERLACKIAGFN
jgi:hypothetical protein